MKLMNPMNSINSQKKVAGCSVTAALLKKEGIDVISERVWLKMEDFEDL